MLLNKNKHRLMCSAGLCSHAACSDSLDYLENLGSKCDPAALFLFIIQLAVIWFGRQFQKIFLLLLLITKCGLVFAISNSMSCFVPLSNSEMKTKTNDATVITKLMFGAFEWYMTSPLYINSFFVSSQLI